MDTEKNDNNPKESTVIKKFGSFIKESMKEGLENSKREIYNEGFHTGKDAQRRSDLISTIDAFLELNVKDGEIYKLLNKYFYVDSIDEVNELLLIGKQRKTRNDYMDYIFSLKMNESDTNHYLQLYYDYPNKDMFLNMTPKKIKEFLKKNK